MRTSMAALLLLTAMMAGLAGKARAEEPLGCDGGDRKSCRYILAATRELTRMLTTADPAPLQRHLDRRALWVSPSGEVRSGAELIEAISRDTRRATATLDRASVRFFGNVAIVTWEESWTAPGKPVEAGRLAGVDTWALHEGRWRIVATAETRLAP